MEHVDKDGRIEFVDVVHRLLEGDDALRGIESLFLDHVVEADVEVLQDTQGKRGVQFVLVLEIEVKGSGGKLGLLGDVLHGGLAETLFGKDPFGSHDDLLAPPFPFPLLAFLDSHKIMNGI